MSRKLFLPLTPTDARPPTVDLMRKRLGGRASTEPGAGELVTLVTAQGLSRIGVVLFVRGEDFDIWIDSGVVRRARRSTLRPLDPLDPAAATEGELARLRDLNAIARDAQSFAALVEGQRVYYQHEAGIGEGTLIEKCRFGGLIERADRAVLGVGFRRLSARPEPTPN
jgi:hypothetical protein